MPRGNPRAKAAQKPQRVGRERAASKPFGRRETQRDPFWTRAGRRVARLFTRPMLTFTACLLLLGCLAALFASGRVGRAVHGVKSAVGDVIADAGFGVYEIRITGNRRVPIDTIAAALGIQAGDSIFFVDLPSARAHIMALDWIASADVVRRYPDGIFVTVVEKRPFALWQLPEPTKNGNSVAVVERSGGIITTLGIEKFAHLPKLVGAGAPESAADLVDAVQAHRATAARVAAYERVGQRRWNLILSAGVVVKLPETGWQSQLDALEHLIVDNGILERDVTEIDLRSSTHYFFLLKGGTKKM